MLILHNVYMVYTIMQCFNDAACFLFNQNCATFLFVLAQQKSVQCDIRTMQLDGECNINVACYICNIELSFHFIN